jgi:exosome complex component RRP45
MIAKDIIKYNERWDRRDFYETRSSTIEKLDGSYILKKGKFFIMGSHNKTIVKPYEDKPHEGIMQIYVTQSNKRSDRLNNLLHQIFIKQKSIDLESLCIKFNKQVYQHYFELRIIESDGYPLEALVELLNFMLEDVSMPVNFKPKCFYFVNLNGKIIRDPIKEEEDEKDGSYTVVMRSKNELIYFEKYGQGCSSYLMISVLENCI